MVKTMPNLPGLYFLQAYPREEIWRLFVDGRFWSKENGWRGYESREPGCLNAALESLCSIALQVEKSGEEFELSVDLIKKIHKKCGKKVEELQEKNPGEIRTDEPVSFGIPAGRASIKGIEEFLSLVFLTEGEAEFGPGKAGPFGPRFDKNYFKNLNPEQIPNLAKQIYFDMCKYGHSNTNHFYLAVMKNVDVYLEKITQSYNQEIKTAETLDEKLKIIVKHIRMYEVLHPFRDANGRTFVNNLLNILLMQQGLPPATFYEPNVFDLYSAEELVVVVKEAIFNTLEIIEQSKKKTPITLYGYHSSLEEQTKFRDTLDSPSYEKIKHMDFSDLNPEKLHRKTQKCLSSLNEQYPLHRGAIYLSDPGEIKLLLSNRNESQINQRIEQGAPPIYVGKTPAHLAVISGNMAMLDELIAKKADLSVQDYDGKTALHYAAECGNMQIMGKILKVVLSQEDAIKVLNIKDNHGKTAFHYAAEFGTPELISALTTTEVIQINEPDNSGSSAITLAYKNHKLKIFDELLNSGADISDELLDAIWARKDKETLGKIIAKNEKILLNKEAFRIAISLGSVSLVKKFLRAGVDIDIPLTKDKATPLMLSINSGSPKLVSYLLKKGANTRLTDISGNSVLHYVFYSKAENREALANIITEKDKKLINQPNANGNPPLYNAVVVNDLKMATILLEMGARVDFEDRLGNNILHSAMRRCDLPIILDIVKKDSTLLHKRNSERRNPFHHALHEMHTFPSSKETEEIHFMNLSDLLLKEGVDLNKKDIKGKTILDIALSKQYFHLCVKLMKAGAHTNISSPSKFLKNSDANSILERPFKFKNDLKKELDDNPLIAMAQINDLYVQIKNNRIRTPTGYAPKEGVSFFKGKSNDAKAHDEVLSVLKELYDSKLTEMLGNLPGEGLEEIKRSQKFFDCELKLLIKNQDISRKVDKKSIQEAVGTSLKLKW
ncbi:TPA: Dot/Icm T4SS effector AnkX [Legionella pneumophila]|uniref:Dot/Icm T4SS effector AnkX n=1 Tax=Legionella pneumophila TaxID=446 RepID=UPI001A309550|nr:Dot/Icm T4SS effector AnkX [Legionella pneumophila]HDS3848350.1 Dot/Icm T4SS effector AnkX [Legionella pneumophila]HDV5737748.1 Dot/Icm T4SS effector AnkX [Legionella pneumophila]